MTHALSVVSYHLHTKHWFIKASRPVNSRMRRGEKILRDANGRLQWTSGKSVGRKTVLHMLSERQISELDTDLFGDRSRGQTIGLPA